MRTVQSCSEPVNRLDCYKKAKGCCDKYED